VTHIVILTPSTGSVSLGYRDTFAAIACECYRRQREGEAIAVSVIDDVNAGFLPHARNVLFAAAVDGPATHAFWWDSDVAFAPRLLFDLLERPEPMICRPYPMRATSWDGVHDAAIDSLASSGGAIVASADDLRKAGQRWTTAVHFEDGKPVWNEDKRLVRVDHCGFGWVLMKVAAMRAFDEWLEQPTERDWRDRRVVHAFDLRTADGASITMAEDISFCARWVYWRELRNVTPPGAIWAAVDGAVTNGDRAGRFADHLDAHGLGP